MQINMTPFQLYKQSMVEVLPKVVKLIPKNKKDLKAEADKIQESIKTLNDTRFVNANHVVNFFRDLLDLKVPKVTEIVLQHLEILIANQLIDGFLSYNNNKTYADEILQMVIECIGIKEDNIHLSVVKLLITILISPLFSIYGKNVHLQNETFVALQNVVRIVYDRMEKLTETTQEQRDVYLYKRCITQNRAGELLFHDHSYSSNNLQERNQNQESPKNSFQNLNSINSQRIYHNNSRLQQEYIDEEQFNGQKIQKRFYDGQFSNVVGQMLDTQIQSYCQQTVANLVDNTEIYYERKKQVGEDNEINQIPLLCVPPINQEINPEYIQAQTIQINVLNENNQVSGKYGWCFICRKTANNYCRETRVAICSIECKQKHIKQIEDIYELQGSKVYIKKNQFLEDGIELFKILCDLSKRDGANSINPQSLRSKIISLEMLKCITENTGIVFLSNFQQLVKEQLIHSVLLNSMSQDQKVVQLSLSILVYLFIDFRDNLKKELEMFTQEILLKMLESSNTIYNHRLYALQIFNLIFKFPRVILEMFANYDCQLNSKYIAQNIVELLAKISQGKYSKAEFSTLFQPGQEQNLRETALSSLVEIISNLIPFTVLSEEYITIGSPVRQMIDNPHPLLGSDKLLDRVSKSINNLDDEEQKQGYQFSIQTESQYRELNLSPSKSGSSHNLGNVSQFNSVGGATGISDSSLNQDQLTEESIQEQRKRKILIQKCIEKFNYKTKQGLQFAFNEGIIEKPVDINKKPSDNEADQENLALWQRSVYQLSELLYSQKESLDRVQFGLFFGDECKYNQDVFQQFLSYYDMANQNIVQSLRLLFKVMYPPNTQEALDRILQQFGEKYIKDNPTVYRNAGVTYTLSYAIMMLQTNLYNPQIKEKEKFNMEKFTKLVSKIDDGKDLPVDQVEFIFNSVKEKPLGFHDFEEYHIKQKEAINSDAVLKTKKFKEEQEKMLAQGKQIIQNESNDEDSQKFIRVLNSNLTRELLDSIWSPLFATFSQGLEQTEDKNFIMKCLEGIKCCIMLLGRFQLSLQQETFVQLLTRNTGLLQDKPFSIKNVLSICCMTEIASTSGNWLRGSWKSVLECLSKIDYYFKGEFANKEQPYHLQLQQFEIDKSNQKLILISLENEAIDKIFSTTSKFDSESIQDFIDCLCQTCKQETNLPKPKTFSLLRISEVAEFNMDRVRIEWNKIWQTLSVLFQEVGTTDNSYCTQLVIDQLKQLSMKFLKKTELSHYSFQKMFLQPFLYIFENISSHKQEIFDLIIRCLIMIINNSFDNLKSGWSVIITIVRLTINKNIDSLIILASDVISSFAYFYHNNNSIYQIIKLIFEKDRTLENLSEEIPQIVDILCKLINYKNEEISKNCISYLNKVIDYLVLHSKTVQNTFSQSQNLGEQKSDVIIQFEIKQQRAQEYEKMLQQLWMPCFLCLSKIFDDNRLSIQRQRIEVLFKLIESYSYLFTDEFWEEIFTQLFIPYFQQLGEYYFNIINQQQQQQQQQPNQQQQQIKQQQQYIILHLNDTIQISYDSMIEIFCLNFNKLQPCLYYVLLILQKSITRFQLTISKIAAEQMQSLLLNIGGQISSDQLDQILHFLGVIFESSLPYELQQAYKINENLKMTYEDVIMNKLIKDLSSVQINLNLEYNRIINQVRIWLISINCVKEYFSKFSKKFSLEQLEKTKSYLFNSYQFATDFNTRIVFRYTLFKNGFLGNFEFPNFLKQQSESRSVLLLIWYENYLREMEQNKLTGSDDTAFLSLFLENTKTSISKFVEYSRSVSEGQEQSRKIQFDQLSRQRQDDSHFQEFERLILDNYVKEKNEFILYLRNNISQIILPCLNTISPIQYYESIHEILDLLIDLSSYSFSRNLLTITCKSCQKCEKCKSKSSESFDVDLKNIIKNILQYITQFMPKYPPQQQQKQSNKLIQQEKVLEQIPEQKEGLQNDIQIEREEQKDQLNQEQAKETISQQNDLNGNIEVLIENKQNIEQNGIHQEEVSSNIISDQNELNNESEQREEEQLQNENNNTQSQELNQENLEQNEQNQNTKEEEDHSSEILEQSDKQESPSNKNKQIITKVEEQSENQQEQIERQQSDQSSEEQIQFDDDEDQVVQSNLKQPSPTQIQNRDQAQESEDQKPDNVEIIKNESNEEQIIIVDNETPN